MTSTHREAPGKLEVSGAGESDGIPLFVVASVRGAELAGFRLESF